MMERNAVRAGIRTTLISEVSEISGRFFSTTDNQTQMPFITWGIIEQRPANDVKEENSNVYDIQLDVWDRNNSPEKTETILDKIKNSLHKNTIETSAGGLACYQTNSFYIYDADPTLIHGIYRFRAEIKSQ